MDTKQTNELTYTKVNEIDTKINEILDMVTDNNPENSTTLKELANNINSTSQTILENTKNTRKEAYNARINTDSIIVNTMHIKTDTENILMQTEDNGAKLDTIISNQSNQTSFDTTTLENKITEVNNNITTINDNINSTNENISQINTNLSTLSQDISEMSNDITTINSNTATAKSDSYLAKTYSQTIMNKMLTEKNYNTLDHKLNEILKSIKEISSSEDEWQDDPYKLDMEYTGKIEGARNPSNYDYYEINKEFEGFGYIVAALAYCSGTTFDYKVEITYTSTFDISLSTYIGDNSRVVKTLPAGTNNTVTFEGSKIKVINNRAAISFLNNGTTVVHHVKVEFFGENIKMVPHMNKYKVNHFLDKIIINKVENYNGYTLILDNKHALTPSCLKKEYNLIVENVFDFDYAYDLRQHVNKCYNNAVNYFYVNLVRNANYNFSDGYQDINNNHNNCCWNCSFAYNAKTRQYTTLCMNYLPNKPYLYYGYNSTSSMETRNYLTFQRENICKIINATDLNRFDNEEKRVYVVTTIDGTNYLYVQSTQASLDIGYGKYATAFFDINNPLKINVYMNDGGYCVKKVLMLSEDLQTITLISQQIIGTYDAYFETVDNYYFVEKDGELYMFKRL